MEAYRKHCYDSGADWAVGQDGRVLGVWDSEKYEEIEQDRRITIGAPLDTLHYFK